MDLSITTNGDLYVLGQNVAVSSISEFIAQRVRLLLRSKPGDWAQYPHKGIHLSQYIGYPNIPSTKVLIESELLEEFERDTILRNFDIRVIYTPTATDSALIEILVTLPDGQVLEIGEILRLNGSIVSSDVPIFTPPSYNTAETVVRTELIEIANATNIFPLKYMPANDQVFVVPFSDDVIFDENGRVIFELHQATQINTMSYEVQFNSSIKAICEDIIPSGIIVVVDGEELVEGYNLFINPCSGIVVSGSCTTYTKITADWMDTSGIVHTVEQQIPTEEEIANGEVFDTRSNTFVISGNISSILENNLVANIEVTRDGYIQDVYDKSTTFVIDTNEYTMNLDTITFGSKPNNEIQITLQYYDTESITSVNVFQQDAIPGSAFPRSRFPDMYVVTTRRIFEAGTYVVQYPSYQVEV